MLHTDSRPVAASASEASAENALAYRAQSDPGGWLFHDLAAARVADRAASGLMAACSQLVPQQ